MVGKLIRLYDEYDSLILRKKQLSHLLDSKEIKNIPSPEQTTMFMQLDAMNAYALALETRIELIKSRTK